MTYRPAATCNATLSVHAAERVEERNIDQRALSVLVQHGDDRRRTRDGCWRYRLTRGEAKRLDRTAAYPRRIIERARELEAIISNGSTVVTTYKLPPDTRFRRSGARPSRQRRWRRLED